MNNKMLVVTSPRCHSFIILPLTYAVFDILMADEYKKLEKRKSFNLRNVHSSLNTYTTYCSQWLEDTFFYVIKYQLTPLLLIVILLYIMAFIIYIIFLR